MTKQSEIINDPSYRAVLDHGFVGLVDKMGTDSSIVQAARVSYGKGTKSVNEDRGLIRYLLRHRHCYHPNMEVLTVHGWKRWGDCGPQETFLVPDPVTRTYRLETLDVLVFPADEDMYVFENERMSYSVTADHKMWFKGKYQQSFTKVPVQRMSKWGWFDPLTGYALPGDIDGDGDDRFRFIGFFLGDGSGASLNRVSFHFVKDRKKDYLEELLQRLSIAYTVAPSRTHEDGDVYYVETPDFLREWVDPMLRAADKTFPLERLNELTLNEAIGLFDGLANSDGSVAWERDQLGFTSASETLVKLFSALAPLAGFDAHQVRGGSLFRATAYAPGRTSLESRAQYHRRERYTGSVYCATTSTGLLAVRGGPDKFGFVCGNTTPFEMCELKFHARAPILALRQWIRHRTANVNEESARYSEMTDEFYIPDLDVIQPQSKDNKQGRAGEFSLAQKIEFRDAIAESYEHSYATYKGLLGPDDKDPLLARELARTVMPVGSYSEFYWKIDLWNLMHFLKLRADSHAQYEIRVYAQAMADIITPIFPVAMEAFDDYIRNALTLSRMERELLKELVTSTRSGVEKLDELLRRAGSEKEFARLRGMSLREFREFRQSFGL